MIRTGIAEYVTNGESKIIVSNKTQPSIILIDGSVDTKCRIEGPAYQHEIQRATRMCIDKTSMELYFIDVSTRPLCIQVPLLAFTAKYVFPIIEWIMLY